MKKIFAFATLVAALLFAGNANAQYQLGKAYMKGKDLPKNEAKAKSLLKKAISNEKDGKEILQEIRKKAAEGDEDDKQILVLIKK